MIEVIFIDDGSTDGTHDMLRGAFANGPNLSIDFTFARHESNQGLGAALRTGFRLTRGDVIVTTDCDGTYDFATIPSLLAQLGSDVDVVTASPYHPLGGVVGVPAYRLLFSRGSSAIYRVLVAWHIHTYTSLFRAYRRKVIEQIPFESNGYLAGTEILVNSMLSGFKVAEYPAVLRRRMFGVSKAKIARYHVGPSPFSGTDSLIPPLSFSLEYR